MPSFRSVKRTALVCLGFLVGQNKNDKFQTGENDDKQPFPHNICELPLNRATMQVSLGRARSSAPRRSLVDNMRVYVAKFQSI